MPPVDLKGSFSKITWISSVACSVADNPGIFLFLCLAFISIVAYRMSPPLSPRTQLEQLNHDVDDIWDLFNASGDDVGPDRRRYRRATYNRLKQIQMGACTFEICLLQVAKDDASWREYFRSAKKVYFNARASCKEIDAIRINVKIANMKIKQQHFCDEKHSYEGSDEIGPEAATE
ncbi:uncharacterized protein EV420DRAFT_72416 [Desarmillaria tabescens]|uniref:Uncharacterized protein n=1 Tax=Armillaria tabescens TaxID=1929756 RepID=A0AA39NQB4_ARMTA|nr:uncharacterized protein EV420DRAFT_72416 [Desarmillaria tabescens]KAK0469861.1 hypothetical protein EV420DRAFT_72416 [Desarmillaria tabescens]